MSGVSADAPGTQARLNDPADREPKNVTEAEWRQLYRECETIADIARRLRISRSRAQRWLEKLGIHEPADYKQLSWATVDLWPHEVDLSPLNCGRCGAEEIYEHPCPECGYDPGGVADGE